MNFSSIFVALPCHSMIFFEFSNINAILGERKRAKHDNGRRGEKTRTVTVLVGGNFETLGSKFRNETEGLLPSPPLKTIIKKEKDINYETSNFHYHGLKIRLGNHAKSR